MPSFLSAIFGSKPSVPDLPQLNLGTEQTKAIAANQAALPGAEQLVGQTNLFTQDQITKMLSSAIPGFGQITQTASSNIESMLQGQIPQDVQDAISRSDAASALAGGYGGTQAGRNLVARDLGLTSLQLTQQGLSSAESWSKTMASIYEPSMMNVQSMFISPMQQYQTDNEQNLQQFQRQWMQRQINAMPDPSVRGIYDTTMTILGEVLSAYGGGQGYDPSKVQGGNAGSFGPGAAGGASFGGFEGDFGAGFGGGAMGLV